MPHFTASWYSVGMRFVLSVLIVVLAGCHYDGQSTHPKPGEVPPLPPASGTQVGYLIDSATDLKLRDDQLQQLKDIDRSLAVEDADIDVQLRQIERPETEQEPTPQEQKAGKKRARHNHAPGAAVATTADATRLHDLRASNDRAALAKAWAILDAGQQTTAKQLLEVRGVEIPGTASKRAPSESDGENPVSGLEP